LFKLSSVLSQHTLSIYWTERRMHDKFTIQIVQV